MTELHITYDETTGNVNVNGPVGNKGLCYLMLECARDAVKDHVDRMQKVAVVAEVPAQAKDNGGITSFIRRGNRRRR